MGKTVTTKGIIYVDRFGKKHLLNREEFDHLIRRLARKAKIEHDMKVIEEIED